MRSKNKTPIPRTTTSKHYPDFIRQSKALSSVKRQSVFPRIGLTNCKERITEGRYKGRYIVFSSDGTKGLWDIATMSMRGVSSCQRWNYEGNHPKHLIGSMLDPYCGIIYITSGAQTKRGDRMSKRAVVRFVLDKKGKGALLIEKVYGLLEKVYWLPDVGYYDYNLGRYIYSEDKREQVIVDIFTAFLKRKTNSKFEVRYKTIDGTVIPKSLRIKKSKWKPYRDSCIGYTKRIFPSPAVLLKQLR